MQASLDPSSSEQTPRPAAESEFTLNELARRRLAAGVDLFVAGQANDDHLSAPAWMRVHLDTAFMDRLLHLRELCAANGLTLAEAQGDPADYESTRISIKYWSVRADRLDFWLFGLPKGAGSVQSRMIGFRKICAALNADPAPGETFGDDCFWYGGALVFQDTDGEDDFLALLDDKFPQLPAREREAEMAMVLAEHKDEVPPAAAQAPARRVARI